jgi:prepilin-type N-terminal cleavage/methylation domain-containing protein
MRNVRGFTLLEMLVVVAVMGVIASITLPDLTPVVRRTEMRGSTGDVVAVLERARRDARSGGRCTRVRVEAGSLVLERANGGHCAGDFTLVQRIRPGQGVSFALESSAAGEIAFVSNGRLRGDGDVDVEDDGARIQVSSSAFENQFAFVGVTSAGLVCTRLMGVVPPFEPSRVCVEEGGFFGGNDTEDGEVELGDGDALPAAGDADPSIVNRPGTEETGGAEGDGDGDDGGDDGDGDGSPVFEEMPPPQQIVAEGDAPEAEPAPQPAPPPADQPTAEETPPPPPPEEPASEETPPPPAEAPPPEEAPPVTEDTTTGSDRGGFESVDGEGGATLQESGAGTGYEA